jgi:hypothetical protein
MTYRNIFPIKTERPPEEKELNSSLTIFRPLDIFLLEEAPLSFVAENSYH